MIKIISGKFKGRLIPTSKNADYRPSKSIFREALFNILNSGLFKELNILENANILDLYSGSGSLSFEAISRGAKFATLIDTNLEYIKKSKEFANTLSVIDQMKFLSVSAINLPLSHDKYDLVFMDPPYNKNFISKTLKSLVNSEYLSDKAFIAIDMHLKEEIDFFNNFELILEKKYGNSKLLIISYKK